MRFEYECSSGFVPAPAPPPPPPAPLDATVHAAIREFLPAPAPRLSPDAFGVTGLATWFWFAHDDPSALTPVDHDDDPATADVLGMTASASENGYAIQATVWVDEYRWELGNGLVLRSDAPGSEQHPAAEHTWRTTDPGQVVRIVARWTGTYTWSAPGSSGSGSMGALDVATDHAYPIREIRAVPAD